MDNAIHRIIHRINHYPVEECWYLTNHAIRRIVIHTFLNCYLYTGLLLIDIRLYNSIDMTLVSSHTGVNMDRSDAGSPLNARTHIH